VGAKFGSNARPMLVAQANAMTHIKTKGAIFVAFIPPCQHIHYTDVLFLFSAMEHHVVPRIAKGQAGSKGLSKTSFCDLLLDFQFMGYYRLGSAVNVNRIDVV
jgi:hypothetical protein